jgi:hypothetical protein
MRCQPEPRPVPYRSAPSSALPPPARAFLFARRLAAMHGILTLTVGRKECGPRLAYVPRPRSVPRLCGVFFYFSSYPPVSSDPNSRESFVEREFRSRGRGKRCCLETDRVRSGSTKPLERRPAKVSITLHCGSTAKVDLVPIADFPDGRARAISRRLEVAWHVGESLHSRIPSRGRGPLTVQSLIREPTPLQ